MSLSSRKWWHTYIWHLILTLTKLRDLNAEHTCHGSYPNAKVYSPYHLLSGLSLRLSLFGEVGQVGAALHPSLSIPCALPMPHQSYSLGLSDRRQRQRWCINPIVQLVKFILASPRICVILCFSRDGRCCTHSAYMCLFVRALCAAPDS